MDAATIGRVVFGITLGLVCGLLFWVFLAWRKKQADGPLLSSYMRTARRMESFTGTSDPLVYHAQEYEEPHPFWRGEPPEGPPNPIRNFDDYQIRDGVMTREQVVEMQRVLEELDHNPANIAYAETALSDYVTACRRDRKAVSRSAIQVWATAITAARRRMQEYRVLGGTIYGHQVVSNAMLVDQMGAKFIGGGGPEHPNRMLMQVDGQQFWVEPINSTTLQVVTGQGMPSSAPPKPDRVRTVMWESGDDQRA